jgi:methionyl-tRNA formyltransferase
MALKIVFAGTPQFAIPSLQALLESDHKVSAVYTKPDSPSGRGLRLTYSPVKQFMLEHDPAIPLHQPITLKDVEVQKKLAEFNADIMVVIAYGLILPSPVLSLFKYGCINVHSSLLPRWRGAAPIQRAVLAGDDLTGVTIMQIDEGLDTGHILNKKEYRIQPIDTAEQVHDNLAAIGRQALLETLDLIETGRANPLPQEDHLATYAAKIHKEEAMINWHEPATVIDRQIRAFHPWPIAYTYLNGQLLKVWQAEVVSLETSGHIPGQIISVSDHGIEVATSQGVIRLLTVQIPGGKPISTRNYLNARSKNIIPGETLLGIKPCT